MGIMELMPERWSAVFAVETPVLELVARGSALYLAVLVLLRVMPRRTGGEAATMDLVFVVLIAQAAAHALGDYSGVGDGVIVIAVLMGWNFVLNALSYRFPLVERLVSSPPLPVVRDGRMLLRNMRREFLTREELMDHLRRCGIDDLAEVKAAYVEGEGRITVVPKG